MSDRYGQLGDHAPLEAARVLLLREGPSAEDVERASALIDLHREERMSRLTVSRADEEQARHQKQKQRPVRQPTAAELD